MEVQKMKKKSVRKAGLLSLIPGIGQIYNGQLLKGIAFLVATAIFLIELVTIGIPAFQGFITLGTVPIRDHSLFLLVKGTLQIIITFIFVMMLILNVNDAKKVAKQYNTLGNVNRSARSILKNMWENGFPYLLTIPAYFVMLFVIVFPVLVTLLMAFTNYDFYHIPPAKLIDWVGLQNFVNMFFLSAYRSTFVSVLGWTIIWTLLATTGQIALGVLTAVISNQKFIVGKKFFRIIFLLPWAIPAFVTIMSFSNMFNDSIGAINQQVISLLNYIPYVHVSDIPWKTDPFWTKTALIMIQTWLGFPYIFVMVTGVLQSIPDDLYEAANIDGANVIQKFTKITLPMILFATAPVFITQYTFNFNNFSIIYLFNSGGPGDVGGGAGSTDILISWIYKLTTGTSPQYALASAVTIVISIIVIGVSLLTFKKTHAFSNEEMM
ncbi:carbohydrate ABC transporter permease [Sporolactobacillus terrae]|uniref:Maltose/maltodextrin transport system permease protein n=1 Tax=Sporolactobacillus terrae TaxID=269673 RepID=A0ABX5Q969_9BACL|nr:sugar ABC transporter permease [Sporolactobacillus terrae]QAA23156.1 sugar ABC transporter permease [Sporolactobacillus terrae]QAA26126.1 sugar ABC transporter permease [Sporolactobacillus terrae]